MWRGGRRNWPNRISPVVVGAEEEVLVALVVQTSTASTVEGVLLVRTSTASTASNETTHEDKRDGGRSCVKCILGKAELVRRPQLLTKERGGVDDSIARLDTSLGSVTTGALRWKSDRGEKGSIMASSFF